MLIKNFFSKSRGLGRSQLPILLNFLLKSEKGKFSISSTDLEIGIEAVIPANIEEEEALR